MSEETFRKKFLEKKRREENLRILLQKFSEIDAKLDLIQKPKESLDKPVTKKWLIEDINSKVKQYFSLSKNEFIPRETKILLQDPPFSSDEVNEAIDSMLSTYVTMGDKVKLFEKLFASYLNIEHGTMVNSGSSANLLALSVLTNGTLKNRIKPNDEIITPAITWATTIYPIVNVGAKPVIVDVDLDTFNINIDAIERAITPSTKAIMTVHLLGNPCDIKRIMEIAEEHDLFVIEDACEAHGAEVSNKKVGTFGDFGTFSFYFTHHMTTIEGGMVVTDNEAYNEIAKALRAHGWIRDLKNKEEIAKKYEHIDSRFLFINLGFNIRPTDIQGGFGIHQIKKLDKFIDIRRDNARLFYKKLNEYSDFLLLHKEREGTKHVWLLYPITIKPNAPFTKQELVNFLEGKKIETRPVMVGNITEQPVIELIDHKVVGDLDNSKYIFRNSFLFPNHQGIGKNEREYITSSISEFIESKV